MEIKWTKIAADDLKFWQKNDAKVVKRIKELLDNTRLDPFAGIGKPEPLKYNLSGCWSRKITGDNRLVYRTDKCGDVIILQCRYHYR